MTTKFSVGEVAIIAPNAKFEGVLTAIMPGDEVQVTEVGPFIERRTVKPSLWKRFLGAHVYDVETHWAYRIRDAAGCYYVCGPDALRKKQPPEEPGLTRLKADIDGWLRSRRPKVA